MSDIFYANVVDSDPGTYSISVAPLSGNMKGFMQGIPLTNKFATLLGVKDCLLPQVGSTVACISKDDKTCLILGVVPDVDKVDVATPHSSRSIMGAGDGLVKESASLGWTGDSDWKKHTYNNRRPTDIVEGEWVASNEFGVLLGLFQAFATLKASELAQVQVIMLDDLVRIISHNYQHYHSMGETKIFQEGANLNLEFGLTHDPKEAGGVPNVVTNDKSTIYFNNEVKTDDSKEYFELRKDNKLNEQLSAIERLKGFVGSLGDFIHLILTLPHHDAIRATDSALSEKYDRGLFDVKVDMDGGLYCRSLKGIFLEKTNWIRVPQRISTPEDSAILTKKALAEGGGVEVTAEQILDEKTPFKFDSNINKEDMPYLYFLQLRDYLSYMFEEEHYRKIKDSNQFELNDDQALETPLGDITQLHPSRNIKYEKKTAGFSLMPNGGIMLRDAWGSAIVMEGGNIFLQPAKDLVMQPNRNLIGKIGNMVSLGVNKDIELTSTSGAMRVKTDKTQYFYSDSSGIILHSNAPAPAEYSPTDSFPNYVGGILLNAPNSAVVSNGQFNIVNASQVGIVNSDSLQVITSSDGMFLKSDGGVEVFADNELFLSSGTVTSITSENTVLMAGEGSTILGRQKQTIGMSTFGAVTGLMEESKLIEWIDKISNIKNKELDTISPIYKTPEVFDDLKFRFPTSTAYGVQINDYIPQTISQQESEAFNIIPLVKWEEKAVNETMPYPGTDSPNLYATSTMRNMEFDDFSFDAYNLTTDHSKVGLVELKDIFKEYKAYGS